MFSIQELRRLTFAFVLTVFLSGYLNNIIAQPANLKATEPDTQCDVVFLADCSGSVGAMDPPDTMLACILHLLDLQRLSDRPTRVAVIVFGPNGITVFAGDDGLPTAAHSTLRQKLVRDWPAPDGATPLDIAFETALKMLRDCPSTSRKSVVWFGDGQPDSGMLRPKEFADISAEMEAQRLILRGKYKDFPDTIIQEMLTRLEQEWQTPGTKSFDALYPTQIAFEFTRTLEHAAALKSLNVRLVTIDFAGGIPALKEIHEAAGGLSEDLLITPPNQAIQHLGSIGLTVLPRVVRQEPIICESQPAETSGEFHVEIPSISESAVVTIEFRPALADFHQNAALSCLVDGVIYEFSKDNDSSDVVLGHDAKGNVATASVFLSRRPETGQLVFQFDSPAGTMSVPACTIYSYVRLSDELRPILRPRFAQPDTPTPYHISPQQKSEWVFSLQTDREQSPAEFTAVESLLTERRRGEQIRMEMVSDVNAPGQFVSSKLAIPPGNYGAEIHVTMKTGVQFSMFLADLVTSQEQGGSLLLDYPVVGTESGPGYSHSVTHIDFERIGDDVVDVTIPLTLRTQGLTIPIVVVPRIFLADLNGHVPESQWIQLQPSKVTIRPNDAETVKLRLRMPDRIEERLADGLFTGRIEFEDPDTGLPAAVERFRDIAGVDDNVAVNQITFMLHRPRVFVSSTRCFREWIRSGSDGAQVLPVNVSIGKPFDRQVCIEVWHDSVLARQLAMIPPSTFRDSSGNEVPAMRFVPLDDELKRKVEPGETTVWSFRVEIDEANAASIASSELTVMADQLRNAHLVVAVAERESLLAKEVQFCGYTLAVIAVVLGIASLRSRRTLRRMVTSYVGYLNAAHALPPLLSVTAGRKGEACIQSSYHMTRRTIGERTARPVAAGHSVTLDAAHISGTDPVELSIEPDGMTQNVLIQIPEVQVNPGESPELEYEVIDGGGYDRQHFSAGRQLALRFTVAAVCIIVAAGIHHRAILRSVQWAFDAVAENSDQAW